jgi:hypothetical protein
MKVVGTNNNKRPIVHEVTIALSDVEAGFLRKILFDHAGGSKEGFAGELYRKLDAFEFPGYEARYPAWKKKA